MQNNTCMEGIISYVLQKKSTFDCFLLIEKVISRRVTIIKIKAKNHFKYYMNSLQVLHRSWHFDQLTKRRTHVILRSLTEIYVVWIINKQLYSPTLKCKSKQYFSLNIVISIFAKVTTQLLLWSSKTAKWLKYYRVSWWMLWDF